MAFAFVRLSWDLAFSPMMMRSMLGFSAVWRRIVATETGVDTAAETLVGAAYNDQLLLPSPSRGFVSADSNTSLLVWPYLRESTMARWARVSLVEATIFIVLVIFSMLRIDLRRPSISRRVANVAVLGAAVPGTHPIASPVPQNLS